MPIITSRLHPGVVLALMPMFLLLLVLHSLRYSGYLADDTFISLRYAQRLLEGKGLTWNDGEYVEGYSNLLWVMLMAAFGWLGFSLESAARGLGAASALLTMLVITYHAFQARMSLWQWLIGMSVFISLPPIAIWMMGGLETCMAMLCMTVATVACFRLMEIYSLRAGAVAGIALAVICLLRPEGPVYTMAIAAALMACSRLTVDKRLRVGALICTIPALVFLGQMVFRIAVYDALFPNTVLVKITFSEQHAKYAAVYVAKALMGFLPLLLYCVFNYSHCYRQAKTIDGLRFETFLGIIFSLLSIAIMVAGGDIFSGFRPFVLILPILVLLTMHAFALGLQHMDIKREGMFIFYVIICQIWLQTNIDVNSPHKAEEGWVYNAKAIGLALKERYSRTQPLVAVYAAGAVSYYSELPTLDIYGLNDRELVKRRKEIKHFGKGAPGHELLDAGYVESKKPDILIFEIPGIFSLCKEKIAKEECAAILPKYRPATLNIPGHQVTIWLRKDSRKVN